MPTTRTTRRTKGAVLAPVYDDPMPRKQRSRGTSVASSQRSNDRQHDPAPALGALSRLASHNEELAAENDNLRTELEKQKSKRWTLRDKQLAEQLAEHTTPKKTDPPQQSEQPEQQQQSQQVEQTPVKSSKTSKSSKKSTSTPATKEASPQPTQTPTSVPRWRQFLSTFTGFTPFSARRPTEPATEPPRRAEQSPLGQLPQNRKRPPPKDEQDTPAKRSQPAQEEEAQPEERANSRDTPSRQLDTIDEQAEPAKQKKKANRPATPTRASKRKTPQVPQTEKITRTEMHPQSSLKRRTVREARESRQPSAPAAARPATRRLEAPSKPKEPNADKRLARMQQLEQLRAEKIEMEKEIARLAAEQEADGIDTRKRKRVKVDELAFIPHNQPGDAVGTFRVPDWDSDDEMEVDDEVPMRKNVFAANAEREEAVKPSPAKTSPVKQAQPPQPPAATPAQPALANMFASAAQQATSAKAPLPPASLFQPPLKPIERQPSPERTVPPRSLFAPITKPADTPAPPVQAAPTTSTKKLFSWPSVGPRAAGDEWPEGEKLAAGQKFAKGFEAWSNGVTLQAH